MKKLLFLALIITSCTKEAILEPIKTPGKIETRDYIDQNFFETKPGIKVQYCKDGSLCLDAIDPIPVGNFETTFEYKWEFIRCEKCGSDSAYGKSIKVKALQGSNIILVVRGYRTGTNIKSDEYYAEIKVL